MFHSLKNKIVCNGFVNIRRIIAKHYCDGECMGVRRCNPPLVNPQNLPHLPIPKLESTLLKFIKSCEPFVSYKVIMETRQICDSFQRKEGKALQNYLTSKAKKSFNWLDDWYTKCAYLCSRDSLAMSTSPIMTFPPHNFRKSIEHKEYIAKLILAVMSFRKLCYCNQIPVETWNKYPLDMGVYKKLFANIRLPKKDCDQLYHHPSSQHIIIMYNNNLFKMKVMNNCGEPLSFRQLMERIDDVMTKGKEPGIPFGLLTSLNRDTWASVYDHMKILGDNAKFLEHIEKSMFLVNIDKTPPCPVCSDEDKKLNSCQNGFHGYGAKVNGANRWYGKTLQFFTTRDGCSGIIFEHSPVEAVPLGKMGDYIIKYISGSEWRDVPDIILRERPLKMNFLASEQMLNAMTDSAEYMEEKLNNFRIHIMNFDRYGKEFIKENKLSPDAIIQAALQFANFRVHNRFVPQHETASTRRFFLGRNDTIRSCTNEVIRFLKNMSVATQPTKEKYELLQVAVRRHKRLTEDVMMGRAIDRHLFGLLMASKELNMPTPELMRCEAYHRSGRFRIVTRQNPSKKSCFTCYSPGLDGGYGCCYNPRSEDINMCVTCRRSDSECDPKKFIEAWACSMKNIADLLMRYKFQERERISRGDAKC
ncbi:carnitine O-acetyltransferase-like [Harmonia axyridis]|uniref:carnitine O-acetyltransferase-like n=1 Tax=Harmonia axyridis TaxID=115357 RepID=UPI001E275438|nr:carnitine O-acetyltransferase-like [Harmonia axyridis]